MMSKNRELKELTIIQERIGCLMMPFTSVYGRTIFLIHLLIQKKLLRE